MPPHLDEKLVNKIVYIIDEWTGKLTWPLIVEAVERSLGWRYSRQTLSKYSGIKDAYYRKKDQLSGEEFEPVYYTPRQMKKVLDRLERLEKENSRMKKQIEILTGQLAQWAYNANVRGVTKADLDVPLPPVNRS
ncbi:hypothetical protein [Pseudodesulfovibrio indicus]|jgi:uncharacterized protein (UPF0335 family)|uniref:hypothetical protein n=1 Tax=Pseudodesulfovibrio indicus TaxID=1716143 RepID=UPI0010643A8F|nr:hypothetical protein [Pseudodesulfovibrio indicus]